MKTTPGAVLVTGASSGIGQAIVEFLSSRDVRVFAAARDLSSVAKHPLITPVRLDVTSAEEARAAAASVRESLAGGRLTGLVNNAGIAIGGPLEFIDLDEFRRQMEVNVVGQVCVTQAFIPLLRESGAGRIVFTSSIGGRVAAPYIGPYAASKHALNGMAESLRRELLPWKIGVSVLAPATVATPIWDKATTEMKELVDGLSPEATELYGDAIGSLQGLIGGAKAGGIPPSKVAEAAHHALFSRRPKAEYIIGSEAKMMALASNLLPYRTFDKAVQSQISKS